MSRGLQHIENSVSNSPFGFQFFPPLCKKGIQDTSIRTSPYPSFHLLSFPFNLKNALQHFLKCSSADDKLLQLVLLWKMSLFNAFLNDTLIGWIQNNALTAFFFFPFRHSRYYFIGLHSFHERSTLIHIFTLFILLFRYNIFLTWQLSKYFWFSAV